VSELTWTQDKKSEKTSAPTIVRGF